MSAVYRAVIKTVDKIVPNKLNPLWNHPAGPKTIFFWAPLFKTSLVLAGLGDLKRPVDALSVPQCSALMVTGFIWSRYSLIIIPKNMLMFCVNMSVASIGTYQVSRIVQHHFAQGEEEKGKENGKKDK